ncbi:MAG: cobyrinate a,c-diamide synthase [Desulfuromonadaceae bacterium]|nr:cobyrinate a,c-diamide synthase [Desulfuromonadaceae bacterium]MDD5104764.1 cobyrinate a,c-diamide synthase [Desulfuromonadaceae bacterium]
MSNSGFLISAPQSGSGKTTVSLAIMAALARRGVTVAPFKCGPDFIDPGYHRAVTDTVSINLDGWMCPPEFVSQTFLTNLTCLTGQETAVIEGVMGLFDGIGAASKDGSSAQIAAITGAPVVLVVNARGMAASAAALVKGFAGFDPEVYLAGVIFNNVGSDSHAALLRESLAAHCPEVRCFGCIVRDDALTIPSRHLGLVTAEDNPLPADFINQLAEMAEHCLDLDGLIELQILPGPPLQEGEKSISTPFMKGGSEGICVAVARDAAFCFMYEDNLRLLREAGAELAFFSPLHDAALPDGIHGIYLPGGYPELYAGQLEENSAMKESIQAAVEADLPVYAECGGFVYLTEGIEDTEHQQAADFVGIFPVRCRMLPHRKALGYRQVELLRDCLVGSGGSIVRGHEFHYSEAGTMPAGVERSYRVSRQEITLGDEGFRTRNCLASYIHLHFGSNPEIAQTFIAACRMHK